MAKSCDVLVVGAGTAGTYYGWLAARMGLSVIILEKDERERVGKRLDVFHIDSLKFEEFGVPVPPEDSDELICVLRDNVSLSPDGSHPKPLDYPFHVMRLTPFLQRLYGLAESAGVVFSFKTTVRAPVFQGGKLIGMVAEENGKTVEYRARLVVDASGTAAVVRTALPVDYGIEIFNLAPEDRFYVVLRYLVWDEPRQARTMGPWEGPLYPAKCASAGWTHFKTWVAPSSDPDGAILGVGATGSYDHAEEVLKEFLGKIRLPSYRIDHLERGTTPYRRPPYSVAGDGFLCLGDSACVTKPFSGEGVTAAWELCKIAAEETVSALKRPGYVTADRLWGVNVRYFRGQGAKFAALLATLPGAANGTEKESRYLFREDVIFSSKDFNDMNKYYEVRMSVGRLLKTILVLLKGLCTGNYSFSNLKALVRALGMAGKARAHYEAYPESPAGFEKWVERAETLWNKAGARMK